MVFYSYQALKRYGSISEWVFYRRNSSCIRDFTSIDKMAISKYRFENKLLVINVVGKGKEYFRGSTFVFTQNAQFVYEKLPMTQNNLDGNIRILIRPTRSVIGKKREKMRYLSTHLCKKTQMFADLLGCGLRQFIKELIDGIEFVSSGQSRFNANTYHRSPDPKNPYEVLPDGSDNLSIGEVFYFVKGDSNRFQSSVTVSRTCSVMKTGFLKMNPPLIIGPHQ
ncbi:hypothetical protein ROZALSC1DRAFT_25359 [Rozella allomycis CSF55]|uniref:Uncharacterized protein n=1 Tax=Rozella allomycis (strain CSF55) TaxID=988480 RepID=A0A4P9YCQ9_ROZAC|nr:hypothetical protein ROZALSC1DRAFT_25359 [Rozella allomycis CSF55]